MAPSSLLKAVALLFFSTAAAAAKTVKVTATSDNKFDPESFSVDKGDTVAFHFEPSNHSVAAGNFKNPCTPADEGGWFSGFFEVDSGESDDVFTVQINTTDPIVFYSTQDLECAGGMVGVINPGTGNDTLAAYRERANGIAMAVSPRRVYGGERVPASDVEDVEKDPEDVSEDGNGSGAAALARASLGWMLGLAAFVTYAL